MYEAFEAIDPMPDGMCVYRSTTFDTDYLAKLQVGDNYVDPGFLSTSLKPEIDFGSTLKLRIFVPKGSKVIPILDNSHHQGEREIILPPMSAIKLIEIYKADNGYQFSLTGVYVGSAWKSFRKAVQDKLDGNVKESYSRYSFGDTYMTESPKTSKDEAKYDPKSKFGSSHTSTLNQKISDALKSGKLTLDNKTQ